MGLRNMALGWEILLLSLFSVLCYKEVVDGIKVPAIWVFGDSLVDVGNNNYINSLAKANIEFYGIDMADSRPTGRFCNAQTIVDLLGKHVGLAPPPAYLNPTTKGMAILKGVNYASGGAGILKSTGAIFLSRIDFDEQLDYFASTKAEMVSLIGLNASNTLLSESLYFVVFGSNDYINNYLLRASPYRSMAPNHYRDILVSKFQQQLTALYKLGGRRMVVSNVGPLGCIPSQVQHWSQTGECVTFINEYVEDFNSATLAMIDNLQQQLPGLHVIIPNSYNIFTKMLHNPTLYGFKYTIEGCCGRGKFRGQLPCLPIARVCDDRRQYMFWDPFHPTYAANVILANKFIYGSIDEVYPFNFHQFLAYF